jgi:hypothetical protein
MAYTSTDLQNLEQPAFAALQQLIDAVKSDMSTSPAELNGEFRATLDALETYRNALTNYRNEVNDSQAPATACATVASRSRSSATS